MGNKAEDKIKEVVIRVDSQELNKYLGMKGIDKYLDLHKKGMRKYLGVKKEK